MAERRPVLLVGVGHPGAAQIRPAGHGVARSQVAVMHVVAVGTTDFIDRIGHFVVTTIGRIPGHLAGAGRVSGMGRLDVAGLIGKLRLGTGPDGADPATLVDAAEVIGAVTGHGAGVGAPLTDTIVLVTAPAGFGQGVDGRAVIHLGSTADDGTHMHPARAVVNADDRVVRNQSGSRIARADTVKRLGMSGNVAVSTLLNRATVHDVADFT